MPRRSKPDDEGQHEYYIRREITGLEGFAVHSFPQQQQPQNFEAAARQVASCVLPAVHVPEQHLCITGMCSVLRYLIFHLAESCYLLGYQSSCLSAPAEVSTWTRFCEVDLPEATQRLIHGSSHQQDVVEGEIPHELAQFETHLRQPIRMHNIRKRMQSSQVVGGLLPEVAKQVVEAGKEIAFDNLGNKVDPIHLYAQSQHLYAEGPDFLLSDAIIFPYIFLLMEAKFKGLQDDLEAVLPKTMAWYNRVIIEEGALENCQDVIAADGNGSHLVAEQWQTIQLECPQVSNQSLYKSDPRRTNPRARVFTRQPDIDRALAAVQESPNIEVHKMHFKIDFLPASYKKPRFR